MAAAFAAAELVDQPRHERPRNGRLAAHQAADHVRQPRRVDALGEISDRSRAHRCDELFLVDAAGHHDDRRARNLRDDLGGGANGAPRRVEVDDADVGLLAEGRRDGAVGVAGLGAVRRAGERMPGADGLTCLGQIRKRYPEVKVVVLSVSTDEHVIQTVLKRGASAYIVKSINPIDLPSALRQAVEGTVYSAIGLPESGDNPARAAGLTERETAILSAVARGLSNEAIGKELWVAEQTVKFHLTNIYRKLGVSNRTEAARLAYQHGLVESPIDDH